MATVNDFRDLRYGPERRRLILLYLSTPSASGVRPRLPVNIKWCLSTQYDKDLRYLLKKGLLVQTRGARAGGKATTYLEAREDFEMAQVKAAKQLYQLYSTKELHQGAYVAVNGPWDTYGRVQSSRKTDDGRWLNLVRGCERDAQATPVYQF